MVQTNKVLAKLRDIGITPDVVVAARIEMLFGTVSRLAGMRYSSGSAALPWFPDIVSKFARNIFLESTTVDLAKPSRWAMTYADVVSFSYAVAIPADIQFLTVRNPR